MSTWVVGDVHGCLEELTALLYGVAGLDSTARYVFLGDYVDRGPDSKGVIDVLRALGDRAVCLIGNHEQMLLDGDYRYAETTFASFGGTIPEEYMTWMKNLPVVHETENAYFVHGGLSPRMTIEEMKIERDVAMWYRHIDDEDYDFGKHTYHGHTPDKAGPVVLEYRTNMDTGCVYGGHLTAARVGPDGRPADFFVVRRYPQGLRTHFFPSKK